MLRSLYKRQTVDLTPIPPNDEEADDVVLTGETTSSQLNKSLPTATASYSESDMQSTRSKRRRRTKTTDAKAADVSISLYLFLLTF